MARRKKADEDEPDLADDLPLAPRALAGKKAGEAAILRWVARNIDNPAPDPAECPDPFAWTMLRHCKRSPEFCAFFIEKLWAKLIPSRSQLDSTGPKVLDGKPTIELIERIQAMRDEAIEAVASRNTPNEEDE